MKTYTENLEPLQDSTGQNIPDHFVVRTEHHQSLRSLMISATIAIREASGQVRLARQPSVRMFQAMFLHESTEAVDTKINNGQYALGC